MDSPFMKKPKRERYYLPAALGLADLSWCRASARPLFTEVLHFTTPWAENLCWLGGMSQDGVECQCKDCD